jgi:hypothetical protein
MNPSNSVCDYEDILEYCGLSTIEKLRSTIAKTEELIATVDSFEYSSYLKSNLMELFNSKYHRIQLHHPDNYTYTTKRVWTVWGFLCVKTGRIHSPINSKTPGSPIELSQTTPYTSMPLKVNPLEAAFV